MASQQSPGERRAFVLSFSSGPAILFVAGLSVLVWKFFGSQQFYLAHLRHWNIVPTSWPGFVASEGQAAAYRFLSCLVLFGVVPAILGIVVLRRPPGQWGVTLGRRRRTALWAAVSLPAFIALGALSATMPELRRVYPINPLASMSTAAFVAHAVSYLLFYLGWEFFFRGFLLFGLEKELGAANAVLIQATMSAMLHIGDPAGEAFGGFAGGILWGVAALRTRSLLPGLVGHAAIGLSLDWFLCFGR